MPHDNLRNTNLRQRFILFFAFIDKTLSFKSVEIGFEV